MDDLSKYTVYVFNILKLRFKIRDKHLTCNEFYSKHRVCGPRALVVGWTIQAKSCKMYEMSTIIKSID